MAIETASPIVNASLLEDETLLRLVLDKPKGNVLSLEMMKALSEALDAHIHNPHLRMVVIRGAGSHFSFGASVEEHRKEQAPSMLAGFSSGFCWPKAADAASTPSASATALRAWPVCRYA